MGLPPPHRALTPHGDPLGLGLLRRAEMLDLVGDDAMVGVPEHPQRVGRDTQVAVAADEHARRVMVEITVSDQGSTAVRFVQPSELDGLPMGRSTRLRIQHFLEQRSTPYFG